MTIAPSATAPSEILLDTLKAHGVNAIHATDFRGPTITQHAFALAAGIKVSKVEALAKDLALSLGLEDVRIVAPIPGTNYVGIETPREKRETVTYADFVENTDIDELPDPSNALPIPIGVGIGGDAVWADLAKLPHLLVAGATNSGKSVALTSMITSLIEHRSPDDLRLWLVDPKRVELSAFADAPQVEQVATDLVETLELLETVRDIMDTRYELFEGRNVRNIAEWNAQADRARHEDLPYHVVVIDELADLMIQAKAEVEPIIVRIAQLARAAGIHLVLATQRPTVNVVTGLIAANVVSRWAFAVRSSTDSKVALEQTGAQALYGQGDSLWFPAGATKPVRIQGVYADMDTVRHVVEVANEGYGNRPSSASPNAASDTDPFDLNDVDLGGEFVTLKIEPSSIPNRRYDFTTPVENLRDLAITDDSTGLGTAYPPAEPTLPTIDGIDLEFGSNLEDPDRYNLIAELAPIITEIVGHAVSVERLKVETKRLERATQRRARWTGFAVFVTGSAFVVAVLGKVFGAW